VPRVYGKSSKRHSIAFRWVPGIVVAVAAAMNCSAESIHYQPYSYDYGVQHITAELGRFSVPEKHESPQKGRITLAFLRLKSTSAHPGPPIVYLAGGPGGSGINLAKGARGSVFLAMREAGDVIALDQRGTGLSEPNLSCPGSLGFPLTSPGEYPAMLAQLKQASRSCAKFWKDRGVDLDAYNVAESAEDLESLRQALGAPQLSLWGSSYATFLGLAAIRHEGSKIFRALFAGVEGPDDTYKLPGLTENQLRMVSELIGKDRTLHSEIPDFFQLLRAVLESAQQKPFQIPVRDANSGEEATVAMGRADVEQVVAGMTGDREGLEQLPRFLLALKRKRLSSPVVQQAARDVWEERRGSLGSAMSFTTDCSSGASAERLSRIERESRQTLLGSAVNFPFPDVCGAWGVPMLPTKERARVRSDVPVLFMSGTVDGRTPPAQAEEVRMGFIHSDHVLIEGAGHGNDLFVSSPEIARAMVAFMKSGTVTTHRIKLPPLRFDRPD
jgi:pimeloyl-ACP methyl ester carboxylesterase